MSMHTAYSTNFHTFAEEVMEDLSVLDLPLRLRSLDKRFWDGVERTDTPTLNTAEYIDVFSENIRFEPCVDLRYAFEDLRMGKSHDEVLVRVINDLNREISQYIKAEQYLHNEKAALGNLLESLGVLEDICKDDSKETYLEEGVEINPNVIDYDKNGNIEYIHAVDFHDTYYPSLQNDEPKNNPLDNIEEDDPGYFTDEYLIDCDRGDCEHD